VVLKPKTNLGGYPLILGRPWLAIVYAYIGCRYGDMTTKHEDSENKFHLYPPTKAINESDITQSFEDHEIVQPFFTLEQAMSLKDDNEENHIITYINNSYFSLYHEGHQIIISWTKKFRKIVLMKIYYHLQNQCQ